MYANMVEDARTIKKRLSDKGQEIDETVIFELLETCVPDDERMNRTEYIINMITDDRDHAFQDPSQTPGSSTTEIKSSIEQCNAKQVPTYDVQSSSTGHTYTETIDLLSDSDDADFYYESLDFDGIVVIDTDTTDIDAVLAPSQCTKSPNQVTPDSSNSRLSATNDNTQNELESLEENNNNNVYVKSDSYDRIRFAESPKPGCSKDPDDIQVFWEFKSFCHSCNSDELQMDAKRIHALLPTYDYNFIYKMLCTNQLATNRVELTLWDILPRERPTGQPLRKRRSTENLCTMECKRSLSSSSRRDPIDLSTTSNANYPVKKEVDTEWKNVRFTSGLSPASPIDGIKMEETTEDKIKVSVVKSKRRASPVSMIDKIDKTRKSNTDRRGTPISKMRLFNKLKALVDTEVHVYKGGPFVSLEADAKNSKSSPTKSSAVPHKMEASSSEDVVPTFYNFLRPPRFTPNTNNVPVVPFVRSLPILAPPKLTNVSTSPPTQVLSTIVTSKDNNTTCLKVLDLSSPENESSGANVAQSSGTLAVTDSQNKTLSSADHPAATLPMCSKSCQLTEHNAWPCVRPYNNNNSIMGTHENVTEDYHQEEDTINKVRYNWKCDATDKGKDCQSLVDINTNASKGKQENTPNMPNIHQEEIILLENARKIYFKLIPMFPCIKTDYIKRLCQCYVKEGLVFDETVLLQNLVEHLLNCDHESPNIKKVATPLPPEENNKSYDVNEQYADLLGIFPEADPVYLREIAEQIYNDPEQIKEFVQSKLENPDYPTRTQYLAKKKITEQQKQYTTGFQLKQFLEIFPDPFLHFEDAKRQCQFNPHAVDFLKHYFSKIRVNTLLSVYSQFQHNLSLTAKTLETMTQNMKTKRYFNKLVLTEDIPLLQECAFIEHKAEFRKHLDDLKVKEQQEFYELKAKGELFECQCCYDDECMPSKCSSCDDGHVFCNSCIVNSTNIILAEGKTHVYCLLNCKCEFPLSILQRVLPPTKFSILLCKRQEAEVMAAGVEGLVSCPFCHFASIPPPEDKVFKCLNPDCMKESCRLCKELNHIPLKCDEVKSDVARLYLEEKMTEALLRKCYRCGRMFYKEEGCNKMTCVCGAQMCYICDKPVTSYDHFQGQGAERSNRCPLWTDDRHMNARTVISVCNETMKHIKEKNPDVKINVDALLPKLPPKSRGPHEDAAYANVLPDRANRIARQIP